jgi:hypothetical protein
LVQFGFYQKKVTKSVFFKIKTGSNQTVSIWLVFSGLTRFFQDIFGFFSVWDRFGLVFWVLGL